MTVIDNRTANRNWPLPASPNLLEDDVLRLIAAIQLADADIATVIASLAGKAAATHGHVINDVSGLQAALNLKLEASALASYVTSAVLASALSNYVSSTTFATGLAGKAALTHGHAAGDVSGLAAVAYNNLYSALSGLPTLGSSAQRDSATAAQIRDNTANKVIETDEAYASLATVVLTDASTIAADFRTFINAKVTLGGNRVINFSNGFEGKSGRIQIYQDGTGSRTLSFTAGQCVFAGGSAPALSTAAGARDVLYYDVLDDGKIFVSLNKALS